MLLLKIINPSWKFIQLVRFTLSLCTVCWLEWRSLKSVEKQLKIVVFHHFPSVYLCCLMYFPVEFFLARFGVDSGCWWGFLSIVCGSFAETIKLSMQLSFKSNCFKTFISLFPFGFSWLKECFFSRISLILFLRWYWM